MPINLIVGIALGSPVVGGSVIPTNAIFLNGQPITLNGQYLTLVRTN